MIYIFLEIKKNPDDKNTYTIKNISDNADDIGELSLSYAKVNKPGHYKFRIFNMDYDPCLSKIIGYSFKAESAGEDVKGISDKIIEIITNQLKKNKSLQDRAAETLVENPKFFKPDKLSDDAMDKVAEARERLHPGK